MCGLGIEVGQEWTIWAYNQNGELSSDLCTRSASSKGDSKQLSFLRSLKQKGSNWYLHHELVGVGEVVDGKANGDWKFYKQGKISSEGKYIKGEKEGEWKWYSKDGKSSTSLFKNGVEQQNSLNL